MQEKSLIAILFILLVLPLTGADKSCSCKFNLGGHDKVLVKDTYFAKDQDGKEKLGDTFRPGEIFYICSTADDLLVKSDTVHVLLDIVISDAGGKELVKKRILDKTESIVGEGKAYYRACFNVPIPNDASGTYKVDLLYTDAHEDKTASETATFKVNP